MSQYRTVVVEKGQGGYGGPLTITPTPEKNKIVYIVGGGMKPDVVDDLVLLVGGGEGEGASVAARALADGDGAVLRHGEPLPDRTGRCPAA